MSNTFYTRFFQVAAAWNIIGAITVLLSLKTHFKLFYKVNLTNPHYLLWMYHYNFWLIVLMLGVGYYLVSRNLRENWAVVLFGVIGKLFIGFTWLYIWWKHKATLLLVFGAVGDIIFALFFIHFLLNIDKLNTE